MQTVEMVDQRWRTTLALTIRGPGAQEAAPAVAERFRELVETLELSASRFRTDSEISAANAAPGLWVAVSPLLVELVEVAVAAAEATEGIVNPCLGRHVDALGYRSWAAGEVFVPAATLGPGPGLDPDAWQRLEVRPGAIRVPTGTELDLGATAKAWLADELAERIAEEFQLDVLANMGGDLRATSVVAPWTVGVDHGLPGQPPLSFVVTDAGLATSGQGGRRWLTSDGPAHHVVDPRTGTSARTRWWAVSVLAATATGANTASTGGLVLDDHAPDWLARRGLDAVLTDWHGIGPATQHLVGRWPQGQEAA